MKITTLTLGPMGNCSYIISQNGKAVLVDPSWDTDEIELNLNGLEPAAVFFTHGHFDHLKDVEPFLKKHNLKARIEENDVKTSALPAEVLNPFKGGRNFNVAGFDVEVIHTPGHSAGSVCVKIGDNLFTGDTLFPGSCGRVDLPGSNPRKMRESLYLLSKLPPETKIYAGHGYGPAGGNASTIKTEREKNIYMKNAVRDYAK